MRYLRNSWFYAEGTEVAKTQGRVKGQAERRKRSQTKGTKRYTLSVGFLVQGPLAGLPRDGGFERGCGPETTKSICWSHCMFWTLAYSGSVEFSSFSQRVTFKLPPLAMEKRAALAMDILGINSV